MRMVSHLSSLGAFSRLHWQWLVMVGVLRLAFHDSLLKAEDTAAGAFFEKSIRPLIVEKCQSCHGEKKAKAGLRLTDRESLLKGGENGPAVVPHAPNESRLVQAVRYLDEPKMPPKQRLSAGEVAAIERWVAEGAPWPSSKNVAQSTAGFDATSAARKLVGISTRSERAASGDRRFDRSRE